MSEQPQGKTMRELRAIVALDAQRFNDLATLWGELTTEYQDELLRLARRRSAELDALDNAAVAAR